jgi:nucleoside-diphosphate-sugar epimerase
MYLDNKSVFLAGSTGAAGSSIIQYIINNYPMVRIRAAYYKHTKPFIRHERVEYVFGDLKSREDCRKMVKGCDCAVMAAANTAGSNVIVSQPWEHINNNLIMNAVMLEAFNSEKVKRVVYIGSATLYQETEGHIREDSLDLNKEPHPAYFGFAWVVRFIEKLCKFWHDKYGMEIVIARASNIFGPYSKFDPATSNFIPAIIRKAVDKMDPFDVWGSPDVTRDTIYSEDFARAIVMMMDNDKIEFDVFNIGTGIKTTVNDVVQWALKYAGHEPSRIQYSEDKPTTSKFRALDCAKARDFLGWKPQFTIEQGVRDTTEWWIQNKNWWLK